MITALEVAQAYHNLTSITLNNFGMPRVGNIGNVWACVCCYNPSG